VTVPDTDIPDTMTRSQLEERRGGFEGNGASDLVAHHADHAPEGRRLPSGQADPPAKRTPAQLEAFRLANEQRHQQAVERRQATNGKPQIARKGNHPVPAVSEEPGAAQPVSDWPSMVGRLTAAGLEVRSVDLGDGWLLTRSP